MKKWLARVLCGLLLFGSVFTLSGCKKSNFVASEFVVLENWFFTSGLANNIIQINLQDEEIVCIFIAENGQLASGSDKGRMIEVKNNKRVYWLQYSYKESGVLIYSDNIAIYLLKGSKIVGYAVLEIKHEGGGLDYEANILKQVLLKDMISES